MHICRTFFLAFLRSVDGLSLWFGGFLARMFGYGSYCVVWYAVVSHVCGGFVNVDDGCAGDLWQRWNCRRLMCRRVGWVEKGGGGGRT